MKQIITQISLILILIGIIIGCNSNLTIDEESRLLYSQKGKEIVSEGYGEISTQLHRYLENGDVSNAVGACNLNATSLIAELSNKYNAQIRRTSLKIRNPLNSPKPYEQTMLEEFDKKSKNDFKSVVMVVPYNKVAFFSPIFVNATCLRCHGSEGEGLDVEGNKLIKELYPDDKAINYKDGDLRGMWSVTFFDDPLQ